MGGLFPIKWFGKKSGLSAIRSGDVNMNIIRPLNSLGAMTVVSGSENAFKYADGNVQLVLKNLDGGGSGPGSWRWAAVKEYASLTEYTPGEIVIVSPTNPDISTCTAGTWVCLQAATTFTRPLWTPSGLSAYWWLIALYPQVITVCVDGVDTNFYVQAQAVP
jgi:hypothetical protein